MKCPKCSDELETQPFGKKGARSFKCAKCKVYFVLSRDNAATEESKVSVPEPKPVKQQPENPAAPIEQIERSEPVAKQRGFLKELFGDDF